MTTKEPLCLGRSAAEALKAEYLQPVRMVLTGEQVCRCFAAAFRTAQVTPAYSVYASPLLFACARRFLPTTIAPTAAQDSIGGGGLGPIGANLTSIFA
jgi:hypothetical protein